MITHQKLQYSSKNPEQEKAREEPVWSAEAMNVCWTSGWKRPEVTDAIEEALEEKKLELDHLVDSERTADAINDLLMTTVTNAARLLLAKRPKDEKESVIRSRAQVSKLLKQRRDGRAEAHRRRGETAKAGSPEQKRR